MSNSEPSAIVLQGMPCIGGLYISFESDGEIGSVEVRLNSNRFVRRAWDLRTPPPSSLLAKLTVVFEPVQRDLSILADLDEVAVGVTHVAAPLPAVIV